MTLLVQVCVEVSLLLFHLFSSYFIPVPAYLHEDPDTTNHPSRISTSRAIVMGIAGNLWILPRGTVEEAESCPSLCCSYIFSLRMSSISDSCRFREVALPDRAVHQTRKAFCGQWENCLETCFSLEPVT